MVQLEKRGIPTVLIGTDKFRSVLEATRKLGGIPEARWVEVAHPLGSLPPAELLERAKLAVEQFTEIVVADAEA